MFLYELALELDERSAELIEVARAAGIDGLTSASTLTDGQVAGLRRAFAAPPAAVGPVAAPVGASTSPADPTASGGLDAGRLGLAPEPLPPAPATPSPSPGGAPSVGRTVAAVTLAVGAAPAQPAAAPASPAAGAPVPPTTSGGGLDRRVVLGLGLAALLVVVGLAYVALGGSGPDDGGPGGGGAPGAAVSFGTVDGTSTAAVVADLPGFCAAQADLRTFYVELLLQVVEGPEGTTSVTSEALADWWTDHRGDGQDAGDRLVASFGSTGPSEEATVVAGTVARIERASATAGTDLQASARQLGLGIKAMLDDLRRVAATAC